MYNVVCSLQSADVIHCLQMSYTDALCISTSASFDTNYYYMYNKIRSCSFCSRWSKLSKVQYLPMVGMVVTISPSLSLYKMVVFPAASRPTVKYKRQSLISYMNRLQSDKQLSKKAGYSSSFSYICDNNCTNKRHHKHWCLYQPNILWYLQI